MKKFRYIEDHSKSFCACVIVDKYFYFFTQYRQLMRMNMMTFKAELVFCENYKCLSEVQYPEYASYDDKLDTIRFFDEYEKASFYYSLKNNYIYMPGKDDNGEKRSYESLDMDDKEGMIIKTQSKKWFFPFLGDNIYYWDFGDEEPKKYNDYPDDFFYLQNQEWMSVGWKYVNGCEDSDNYYLPMHCTNYMPRINKMTGELTWVSITFPDNDEQQIWKCFIGLTEKKIIYEGEEDSLANYCRAVGLR